MILKVRTTKGVVTVFHLGTKYFSAPQKLNPEDPSSLDLFTFFVWIMCPLEGAQLLQQQVGTCHIKAKYKQIQQNYSVFRRLIWFYYLYFLFLPLQSFKRG